MLRPTTMDNELQKIKVRKFAESLRNLHFIRLCATYILSCLLLKIEIELERIMLLLYKFLLLVYHKIFKKGRSGEPR